MVEGYAEEERGLEVERFLEAVRARAPAGV
jgi:hypothetical protein